MSPESASIVKMLVAGGCLIVLVIGAWLGRVAVLAHRFLRVAAGVLEEPQWQRPCPFLFYGTDELRGTYKGRDVIIGVAFAGIKGELMSFPHIALRLREAIGYNLNRLPHYAVIEKGHVVYRMKFSVLLAVFDRNYPQFFSRNYLIIALDRLFATAEDLERGRTYEDVFK